MTTASNTVIIGAGIIGTATAFYLSESTSTDAGSIHLIECSPRLFSSASGYAGGFLAKDWFSPTVASLGALSFDLHRQLAERYDGRKKWGYCLSTGISMTDGGAESNDTSGEDWLRDGNSRAEAAANHDFTKEVDGPAWLTRIKGTEVRTITESESVAQLDPLRLCEFLLQESKNRGVRLHHPATVRSVSKNETGELSSVRIAHGTDEIDIPCTRLIITAGAWTAQVFATLFPKADCRIPISQYAGHSLVVRSPRWTAEHEAKGCHAVFATDSSGYSPEIFGRVGGDIFVGGVNDSSIPLPKCPTESNPHPEPIEALKDIAKRLLGLPDQDDLEVVRQGLCFRPVTNRGPPLVCRVPDNKLGGLHTRGGGAGGVFISAGHGPWGISQSLGTGKVMSEVIEGKQPSAEIRGLAL